MSLHEVDNIKTKERIEDLILIRLSDNRAPVGKSGMLLHRKGKLTIAKSNSSRLSYSKVVSLPLESVLSKISGYEADLSDSVVSFISSSSGYIKWT
jgi:hypothetical protein